MQSTDDVKLSRSLPGLDCFNQFIGCGLLYLGPKGINIAGCFPDGTRQPLDVLLEGFNSADKCTVVVLGLLFDRIQDLLLCSSLVIVSINESPCSILDHVCHAEVVGTRPLFDSISEVPGYFQQQLDGLSILFGQRIYVHVLLEGESRLSALLLHEYILAIIIHISVVHIVVPIFNQDIFLFKRGYTEKIGFALSLGYANLSLFSGENHSQLLQVNMDITLSIYSGGICD